MISKEGWVNIRNLSNQGLTKVEIAKMLCIDRKTVAKYIEKDEFKSYERRTTISMLDSFKDYIRNRLSNFNLTSVKIFEEIRNQGFKGKYGIVNLYVREIKKVLKNEAVLRFETMPGEQAQVDWGSCGELFDVEKRRTIKVYCFVIVLGYSRTKYVEFFEKQDITSFLEGHNHAFEYFGGYTKEILYDNLKSVVIKRKLRAEDSEFNKKFMDFAGYYGFKPILCRPYKPNTKGKVESSVSYVKNNFLAGRKFKSLREMNEAVKLWLMEVNNKFHGTTKEKPFERLKRENLLPIAGKKMYDTIITEYRKVYKDCHLSYGGNFYSVPYKYAGKEVSVKKIEDEIVIKYREKEIARHILNFNAKGVYITQPEHIEGLKELRFGNGLKTAKKHREFEENTDFRMNLIIKKYFDDIVEERSLNMYEEGL